MKPTILATDMTCRWCGELIELLTTGEWAHLRELEAPHDPKCVVPLVAFGPFKHDAPTGQRATPATDDWCRRCGTRESGCDADHACEQCRCGEEAR